MDDEEKTHRVLVIGAGGVGIRLAEDVARMLEWNVPYSAMVIVDGDNFEPKNRERQSFQETGNKAEVLAKRLTSEFPQVMFLPLPQWVVDKVEEIEPSEDIVLEEGDSIDTKVAAIDLLAEDDIVFSVVDNFSARKSIFEAAKSFDNIDVFTGGNDEDLFGSVYHYQRRDGEDVTLNPNDWKPEYVDPPDRNPGDLSCQERAMIEGGTQTLAANAAVAAYLLARAHLLIVANEVDHSASEIYFDLRIGMASPHNRSTQETLTLQGVS